MTMIPRVFRTELCSKCNEETDRAGLVQCAGVRLCGRCLEVELRGGQRIVRGHVPWYVALPIGVFVIGGPITTLLQTAAASRVQVATLVGLTVVALARAFPLPGYWGLLEVPAERRLDVDRAIALAKRVNSGTTADADYVELKRLCTGPKEMEALLVIAQFGDGEASGV